MKQNPRQQAILELSATQPLTNQFNTKQSSTEVFGQNVFSEEVMQLRLPKDVFAAFKRALDAGKTIETRIADVVATAMKDWALEKGATHFTHLFFPMTGGSAEKHDSFIVPTRGGKAIEQFSGKELIKGESDASSFPSGGIRATFEARGYTAWDPTSPAFIMEGPNGSTLVIPTCFLSYTGVALDKKTPLLKSQEALSKQAGRVLQLFGQPVERVITTVGAEQEYFLIDRKYYFLRPDLVMTGRTLFGSGSEKNQQLEDQYFGSIRERVLAFMQEVEHRAMQVGIPVKTRHNEVAPAQFEIAPIYELSNVASDHNVILMELLRTTALKYGFACLLHEKPFAGVNGSGKHNNWSMATLSGKNLLDPGSNPSDNAMFLLFLAAILRAVDRWAKVLRVTVATAGNDHRLGANEAPPAIISAYLGDELLAVVDSVVKGTPLPGKTGGTMAVGVTAIPAIPLDNSDRNRTSPFAFTGNKFEFRAVGSAQNVAGPNIALNTAVAESLDVMTTAIEKEMAKGRSRNTAVNTVIKRVLTEHYRIIFNGNGYSAAWVREAKKRGLPNLRETPEALDKFIDPDVIELFTTYGVFTIQEVHARHEILVEQYVKMVSIEAGTTAALARTMILPAATEYLGMLAATVTSTRAALGATAAASTRAAAAGIARELAALTRAIDALEKALAAAHRSADSEVIAVRIRDRVKPAMAAVRTHADILENLVGDDYWPLPKYREMLFMY
ncbi:MAG TPA: glutamine synthetase III [bacterium]|nr:glutamine synthetase III [bacterium]